jgi:GAF domain-containing protein
MGRGDRLSGAASSGLLPDEATCSALLEATAESARRAFGAAACSIALFDEGTDELVFAAVAGEGAGTIVGDRFPADTGIAGWVLTSQQPLAVDEVGSDPRFAADVAERTGYVPKTVMAAPLLRGGRGLGVLSLLDRARGTLSELAAMDLIAACAGQASIAAEVVEGIRRARGEGLGEDAGLAAVARLAAVVEGLQGRRREDSLALLNALERLLRRG